MHGYGGMGQLFNTPKDRGRPREGELGWGDAS